MTAKTMTKSKRRTTLVPVTTMEELPVLADEERAALAASLKQAEAHIKAGDYADYDPKKLKNRLLRIYRAKKR